jgi:hypothetical protein
VGWGGPSGQAYEAWYGQGGGWCEADQPRVHCPCRLEGMAGLLCDVAIEQVGGSRRRGRAGACCEGWPRCAARAGRGALLAAGQGGTSGSRQGLTRQRCGRRCASTSAAGAAAATAASAAARRAGMAPTAPSAWTAGKRRPVGWWGGGGVVGGSGRLTAGSVRSAVERGARCVSAPGCLQRSRAGALLPPSPHPTHTYTHAPRETRCA